MGTYFNPDNGSFKQAVRSFIYVDKTELIRHTNRVLGTEYKCIALSHARRFGKSQAAGRLKWAIVAVQSSYGFEWQGDNILIARENLLFDVAEHYEAKKITTKITTFDTLFL